MSRYTINPSNEWWEPNLPVFNVQAYGADPTGIKDSTGAIQAAIDAAAASTALDSRVPGYTWFTTRVGGTVVFPRGYYKINSTINVGNYVTLVGAGARATAIVASESMTDSYILDYFVDASTSMFNNMIVGMTLSATNNANITSVVHADSWQEGCGMRNCVVTGYRGTGLLLENGYGGAARVYIHDCEFYGFASTTGIHVESTVPNAFMVHASNLTITSSSTSSYGIRLENGRASINNLHVENTTHGIYIEDGGHLLQNVTGGGTVVNLITLDSGFTGRVRAYLLDPNGASGNTWNDLTATDTDYTGFKMYVAFGAD